MPDPIYRDRVTYRVGAALGETPPVTGFFQVNAITSPTPDYFQVNAAGAGVPEFWQVSAP